MEQFLKDTFHRASFRPKQRELITAMINGRDCIALLPTSAGKSLCFQFPALYLKRCYVIISPLKALMANQIADLRDKFGIVAYQYVSGFSDDEKRRILEQLTTGVAHLLYTTPESMQSAHLCNALDTLMAQKRLGGFVFDEAHVIVEQSTFRPTYASIRLRPRYAGVPIAAFSATLTPAMITTIRTQLSMVNVYFERAPLNRPNITPIFDLCEPAKRNGVLMGWITKWGADKSGIIYCNTATMCKNLVKMLNDKFSETYAAAYFGSKEMSDAARMDVLDRWVSERVRVVVSTSAFGMGVSKESVLFVVHYDPPKSPTELLQGMGRAGRDGKQSYYLVFCNHSLTFMLFSIFSGAECAPGIWDVKKIFGKEHGATCARPRMLAPFSTETVACSGEFEKCTFCSLSDEDRAALNKEAEVIKKRADAARVRKQKQYAEKKIKK